MCKGDKSGPHPSHLNTLRCCVLVAGGPGSLAVDHLLGGCLEEEGSGVVWEMLTDTDPREELCHGGRWQP